MVFNTTFGYMVYSLFLINWICEIPNIFLFVNYDAFTSNEIRLNFIQQLTNDYIN